MRVNGYIRLLRVGDWLHLLGITLLGGIYASRTFLPGPELVLPAAVSALFLAYGYSLNETFDAPVTGSGAKAHFLEYPFTRRKGAVISAALFAAGVILAALHSASLAIVILCGAFFGWLYSAPPVRAKSVPFAGWLVNSLCFVPLFLAGALASSPVIDGRMLAAAFHIAIAFLPFQLIHELEHRQQDIAAGIRTTAASLDTEKTLTVFTGALFSLDIYSALLWRFFGFSVAFLAANLLFSLWMGAMVLRMRRREGFDAVGLKKRARFIGVLYGIALAAALC